MDNTRKIEKIQKLGEKKKSGAVINFLNSKDVEVVKAAIETLALIQNEESVNSITPLIDDADPQIRSAAAKAMAVIGTEHSKTYLHHRYSVEKEESVKADIMEALQIIRSK